MPGERDNNAAPSGHIWNRCSLPSQSGGSRGMRNAMGMVCCGTRPRSNRGTGPVCWHRRAGTERREGPGLGELRAAASTGIHSLETLGRCWKGSFAHIHTGFRELPGQEPTATSASLECPCGGRPSVPGGGTGSGRSQPALPGCAGTRGGDAATRAPFTARCPCRAPQGPPGSASVTSPVVTHKPSKAGGALCPHGALRPPPAHGHSSPSSLRPCQGPSCPHSFWDIPNVRQ